MILRRGDMWAAPGYDVRLFTGNSTVTGHGCLVMGRGAAREALGLYPNCDRAFGSLISGHRMKHPGEPYGVLIHPDRANPMLGVFQVKIHYADRAKLTLIHQSCLVLKRLADGWASGGLRASLNFPGTGAGGLLHARAEILTMLRVLPDNVDVWEHNDEKR